MLKLDFLNRKVAPLIVVGVSVLVVFLLIGPHYSSTLEVEKEVRNEHVKADVSHLIPTNSNLKSTNPSPAGDENAESFSLALKQLEDDEIVELSKQAYEDEDALQKLVSKLPEISLRGISLKELAVSNYSRNKRLPFSFQILDQDKQPVSLAQVEINYRKLGLGINASFDKDIVSSDHDGVFEISDRAVSFRVNVSKPGYVFQDFDGSFVGKGEINLHDLLSKTDPYIIEAWKQQSSQKLLAGRGLLVLPANTSPISVPFHPLSDSLEISVTKFPGGSAKKPGKWKAVLKISSGGGLFEKSDEFGFLAPETGYTEEVEIDFTGKEIKFPPHSYDADFYYMAKNGSSFGIIELAFLPYSRKDEFFRIWITYRTNENGSRVLESGTAQDSVKDHGVIYINQ